MQEVSRSYDQADENARQVVRRTRNVTRRKYTPEEKVRIVIEGIRGEISVSALCRREGINPGVYYKWLKDYMEAGKSRLKGDTLREANKAEVDALKRENERLKELVAQLSVENLVLKKASVRAHGQALCEKGGPAQGGGPSDRREVSSAGQADPPRAADSTLDLLPLEEQVSRQGV